MSAAASGLHAGVERSSPSTRNSGERADLQVQIRAVFLDELTQRSLDVEHAQRIGTRRAGLERLRATVDGPNGPQATSRSFCASASDCSFFSDWFSIWRIRSRVTLNVRPTSSSVRGCSPPRP